MRPLAFTLSALAVVLFFGTAIAQAPHTAVGGQAVRGVINGSEHVEPWLKTVMADRAAAGSTVARSISWGSRLRYAAQITAKMSPYLAVPLLVYEAVDHFFLDGGATGTELDAWYAGLSGDGWDASSSYCSTGGGASYEVCYAITGTGGGTISVGGNTTYGELGKNGWQMTYNVTSITTTFEGYWNVTFNPTTLWGMKTNSNAGGTVYGYSWSGYPPDPAGGIQYMKDALCANFGGCAAGGTSDWGSFADFLDANPAARDVVHNQIVPDYMNDRAADSGTGSYPYTYGQPLHPDYGDIGLDPAPNENEWYDNPYADPSIDSDGDGYKDWEEDVAGTDPSDADSYPDASPGAEPGTDTDGDGIPDQYDPCPHDASNRCAMNIEDLALESTQADIRSELQTQTGILEQLADGTWVDPALPADPVVDVTALENPDVTFDAAPFEALETSLQGSFDALYATASAKAPFAYAAWIDEQATAVPTDECPVWSVSLGGQTEPVSMCGNAAEDWMRQTGRPLLVVLLWLGFAWTMVTLGLRS